MKFEDVLAEVKAMADRELCDAIGVEFMGWSLDPIKGQWGREGDTVLAREAFDPIHGWMWTNAVVRKFRTQGHVVRDWNGSSKQARKLCEQILACTRMQDSGVGFFRSLSVVENERGTLDFYENRYGHKVRTEVSSPMKEMRFTYDAPGTQGHATYEACMRVETPPKEQPNAVAYITMSADFESNPKGNAHVSVPEFAWEEFLRDDWGPFVKAMDKKYSTRQEKQ